MRGVTFAEGEFYHLYNRGVDKRVIFSDPAEHRRFMAYLLLLNDTGHIRTDELLRRGTPSDLKPWKAEPSEALVAIGAYCLMPNHFHLYVTPLKEGGVSKFMQRLLTAYTMYFNEKHERSGVLLQGAFKAKHVATEEYARYLFSYIHLNAAKIVDPDWKEFGPRDFKRVREYVRSYPYSSFGEYSKKEFVIISPGAFPDYLRDISDFDAHIDDWLRFREQA
jgi:putative transposase